MALPESTPEANAVKLGVLLEHQRLLHSTVQRALRNNDEGRKMSASDAEELSYKLAESYVQILGVNSEWYSRLVKAS